MNAIPPGREFAGANCPKCGRWVNVRKDGRIWAHGFYADKPHGIAPRCDGSDMPAPLPDNQEK